MKTLHKLMYFFIALIVWTPISVGYVMQGGVSTEWLGLFHDNIEIASKLFLTIMAVIQIGTFIGCYLFLKKYVPENNHEIIVLMGNALYMLNPVRLYVCYDLADLALTFFFMCLPFLGWALFKVREKWQEKNMTGMVGYFAICLLCIGTATIAIRFNPIETHFDLLRERYWINDILSSFIYRSAHPGMGLGLILAVVLYSWWLLVKKHKMKKSEIGILIVTLLCMIAAGCNQNMTYGPLLAMGMGTSCLILLVTGRDYVTDDDTECHKYQLWLYGTIMACLAVGSFICNNLMYYRVPLN